MAYQHPQRQGANHSSPYAGYFYPETSPARRKRQRRPSEPSLANAATLSMAEQAALFEDSPLGQSGATSPLESSVTSSNLFDFPSESSLSSNPLGARHGHQSSASLQRNRHGVDMTHRPRINSTTLDPSLSSFAPTTTMGDHSFSPAYSGTSTPLFPGDVSGAAFDPNLAPANFFPNDFMPMPQSGASPPSADLTAGNLAGVEEEKRRRNTAASARFRMKKKEREQALEKTAKELQEKVTVLEQKLSQMELENTWLRGLITEKSRQSSATDPKGNSAIVEKAKSRRGRSIREEDEDEEERSPGKRTDGVGTRRK